MLPIYPKWMCLKAWQGQGAEGKIRTFANISKMDQSHRVREELRKNEIFCQYIQNESVTDGARGREKNQKFCQYVQNGSR